MSHHHPFLGTKLLVSILFAIVAVARDFLLSTSAISSSTAFVFVSAAMASPPSPSSSTKAARTILVTGGNRGIGKAVCRQLLVDYDDTRVILASRDKSKGQQAAQDILSQRQQTDISSDRLMVVEMDTASDESVQKAAVDVKEWLRPNQQGLYGLVNNAGIHSAPSKDMVMQINYFGPRRVCDTFLPLLQKPGGRIVNVASASGPNWVSGLRQDSVLKRTLSQPWTLDRNNDIAELDELARSIRLDSGVYGISKAFLNAYTVLLAKHHTDDDGLIINSVTPGFIATDMGLSLGATKPVPDGAKPIVRLLMDETLAHNVPTGRYYGSDGQRSPLDVYRGPGDPVYQGPDWQ